MPQGYRLRHLSSRFLVRKHLLRLAIVLMYATAIGVALFYGYQKNWATLFYSRPLPLPLESPLPTSVPLRPENPPTEEPVDLESALAAEAEEAPLIDTMEESDLTKIFKRQEERAQKKPLEGRKIKRQRAMGVSKGISAEVKRTASRKKPFRLTGHQV